MPGLKPHPTNGDLMLDDDGVEYKMNNAGQWQPSDTNQQMRKAVLGAGKSLFGLAGKPAQAAPQQSLSDIAAQVKLPPEPTY